MKYFKTLSILVVCSIMFLYACNDKTSTSKEDTSTSVDVTDSPTSTKQETTTSTDVIDTPAPPKATTPKNVEPPQNANGVWHYTCSKGCLGGAGSAVNCTNCGSLLAHNSAYHAKANSTPTASNLATPFLTTPNSTAQKEPSQNAAGVWHYTCGKGCAGGAGSASPCVTCGTTLAHNSAYHNK